MRLDELHAELDRAAGPERAPTDEFVTAFLHRQSTLRARRRLGVAALIGTLAVVLAVVSVVALQPGPSRRSVETPAGPTATTPTTLAPGTEVPVAHLELASPILTAGTTVNATVVVENDTGQPVEVGGCGSPFQAIVGNDEYEQTIIWTACFQTFTLLPGETRFPVSILVGYTECSWNGGPGPVPCPPVGPGFPDFPPFPDGAYRLTIESTTGDLVEIPPPTTVHVTTTACATEGPSVRVPDVRRLGVGDAMARLGRKGLVVVPVPSQREPRTGHAVTVVAQQPTAGSTVPRNSCVVMRTR